MTDNMIFKTVKRTWRERLFSRPFFVATKSVRDFDAESLRDMVSRRPMVSHFEMRSSTPKTRVPPRVPVSSSHAHYTADTPSSPTVSDNYLSGALVGYAFGSAPTPASAEQFSSGGGGDFGGGGASASWSSSDSSSCSSSSSDSSSSSSSSDSCSSSSSSD